MKIIADTNILARLFIGDDVNQLAAVHKLLKECEEIIIPTHVFCELCWVLSRLYKVKQDVIMERIGLLTKGAKVNFIEEEVEAGLSMMREGGDFADGVNAYTGRQMSSGNIIFASFDKKAVRLLVAQGVPALIPD